MTDTSKKIADVIESNENDSLITLSTGVVLKAKKANPIMLIKVFSAFPRPEPPVVFIKSMGREMENPDDPDYIQRVKDWETRRSDRILNAMIMLGTELVSLPKGMKGPDSNEWLEKFRILELQTHQDSRAWRYMQWVLTEAVVTEDDIKEIQKFVGRLSGVREEDVASAESFPGSN